MRATITVESPVPASARVAQVQGLFDLTPEKASRLTWEVHLPLDERPWSIGLITGPSGCGKSTIARYLWPRQLFRLSLTAEQERQCVLDLFPAGLSVKDV